MNKKYASLGLVVAVLVYVIGVIVLYACGI